MAKLELDWLPHVEGWAAQLKMLEQNGDITWPELVRFASARLDFLQTDRLDRLLSKVFGDNPPAGLGSKPVRLALLGASTLHHLHGALRVAALRRGIWLTIYETEYGQYYQELLDRSSALHRFKPDVVLFALDARHLTAGIEDAADSAAADHAQAVTMARLQQCWTICRETLGASVVQQTVLPVLPSLLGNNDQRLPGSPARMVQRLNAALWDAAEQGPIDLLDLAGWAAQHGVREWYNPVLWHRAKQEISPVAAPMYGELFARLLAALQGRSAKCLVLDLDNTLWGGVIGDDGLKGIVLGQGSALGEAFAAVQAYALQLSRRGVILAVCSKNDEANALAAFESHPEMVLRRKDIASFFANWDDKATNLRRIAHDLNIGIDSLVFLDDNPFERNLVRQELPQVAVPEIPDDEPALIPQMLADAGYFEQLSVTDEDRARGGQYQANRERLALQADATDLPTYLRSLDMEMRWRAFDAIGLERTVQLINKTNQFNLRTQRYATQDVLAVIEDPAGFGLQLRLIDRFGDNGIIAIIIGRMTGTDCFIDTWLMSCRVLGRQMEEATLNLVADTARQLGAKGLIGEYLPTAKNGMVRQHYENLGFAVIERGQDGRTVCRLDLTAYAPRPVIMRVCEG